MSSSRCWFWSCLIVTCVAIAGRADAAVTLTPPQIAIGGVGQGAPGMASAALTSDTAIAVTLQLATTGDCRQFTIASPTSLTIGPIASTVTVQLTPTSSGPKSCALQVRQGATTLASFDVNGTGILPGLAIDPAEVDVGPVESGQRGGTTFTLTNTGSATLTFNHVTFETNDGSFAVSGNTGPLEPGASTQLFLQCDPHAVGLITGELRIESNRPPVGLDFVPLRCTGTAGVLAIDPTSLHFGTVLRGRTKALTFTLSNRGNLPVSPIGTFGIEGSGTGYSFDRTTLPAMLAPGESRVLTVVFAPATANDGGNAQMEISGQWGSVPRTTSATLLADGDATDSAFDVAPTALDFGAFQFDAAPERSYQITNPGDTTIAIQSAIFTPDAGTGPTEFGFAIARAGTPVTLPQTLAPGERLDVTATARPSARTGLLAGHVDVSSNIPGAAAQRVTLTGTALAAAFSAPALVDFGSVDVRGAAASQTIVISNTGSAALAIASIAAAAESSAAFTATLPTAAVHLAPGEALSIPVTYQPARAQPAGVFETQTLVASIAGTVGGPHEAMIAVRGRGIDRAIQAPAAQAFPPTYRYPGSHAPERSVTVHNAGEAQLVISAVMVGGAPVWQLVDPAPVTVPGGGSHDFAIRFSPTAVGPAPDGRLTLTSDDTAQPMAVVALTGTGVARSVAFGAATVDLGTTAPGAAVNATLTIKNLDATTAVTVRELKIDNAAFTVVEAAGAPIDAGGSRTYTVRFAPTATGTFQGQATLYLDDDPDPQATVALTGHAETGATNQGGGGGGDGGCSAGGGAGIALVAAIAFVAGRRRRRAGNATRPQRF